MRCNRVNQALRLPRLTNGVTAKSMGLCWGPGALMTVMLFGAVSWYFALVPLGFSAIVHGILRWGYKNDPRVFEIYERYSNMASRYHPNPREKLPIAFQRPVKVGRGVRM